MSPRPPNNVGAISLFVADPQRSKAFYSNVFGLAPVFEDDSSTAFKFENLIVNLVRSSEAGEMIAPGVVAQPGAGASFQLSIFVDDVDAVCAELAARDVELVNGPVDRIWGMRTATFTDPDGHVWEIAAEIARS